MLPVQETCLVSEAPNGVSRNVRLPYAKPPEGLRHARVPDHHNR